MKNRTIGFKIGLGFVIVLILFVGINLISLATQNRMIKSQEQVTFTFEVIDAVGHTRDAINNMIIAERGYIITGGEDFKVKYDQALDNVTAHIDVISSLVKDNDIQSARLLDLKVIVNQFDGTLRNIMSERKTLGFDTAKESISNDVGIEVISEIKQELKTFDDEEMRLLALRSQRTQEEFGRIQNVIIIGTIIAVIFIILLIFFYSQIIAKPLRVLSEAAEEISTGDLTAVIANRKSRDEVGVLTSAFSLMQKNLKKQFNELNDGVQVLTSSTAEIIASITELSAVSSETATSISQTTTTVAQIKQTADVSSQKAGEVSKRAESSMDVARGGTMAIVKSLEGMQEIKKQMNSIAEIVLGLSQKSESIGEIVNTVKDLAEQSNLLAVNASIEAAKAGEMGRGFNVVAQEIKILADRSKASTKEINGILNEIKNSINNTVMATEQGTKSVDSGVQLTETSREVIEKLSGRVQEFTQVAMQIAAASRQQLVGLDQINESMEVVSQASSETAASTKQSESSVAELQVLAGKLQNILTMYKLS